MKKIALAVVLLAAINIVRAQNGNNICVWNAIRSYTQEGGSRTELESAMKCSDEATANESTAGISKTWYYRGQLYRLIVQDSVLNKKYPAATLEGIKAFKKLNEINDPKFKDWKDAYDYLNGLAGAAFNSGAREFNAKNYAQATQFFYSIKDVNDVLVARKGKLNQDINLGLSLEYACRAASSWGDKKMMLEVSKDFLAVEDSALAYYFYGVALRNNGDTVQSAKVMNDGLTKYPKDQNLLREKVVELISSERFPEATKYIDGLLENDPKLDAAWFLKGLAYSQSGKVDSAAIFYEKAVSLNPKNTNAYNNLGAIYVNKAKAIYDEMTKLGNSAEDSKKYDQMIIQIKDLYLKAKPYLERVKELNPSDEAINRTLAKINTFLESNKK